MIRVNYYNLCITQNCSHIFFFRSSKAITLKQRILKILFWIIKLKKNLCFQDLDTPTAAVMKINLFHPSETSCQSLICVLGNQLFTERELGSFHSLTKHSLFSFCLLPYSWNSQHYQNCSPTGDQSLLTHGSFLNPKPNLAVLLSCVPSQSLLAFLILHSPNCFSLSLFMFFFSFTAAFLLWKLTFLFLILAILA